MVKPTEVSRRQTLLLGAGGLAVFGGGGLSMAGLASADEDPAAIITSIANDAFGLFGQLNGVSNNWSSRRQWAKDVTKARFATKVMGAKAGGVFIKEFDPLKRRTFDVLIEDVVAEFILDIFAVYEPSTTFTVNRVRPNRSNTAIIMESTVVSRGESYKVKWTVIEDEGRGKISDVSIFGLNLVSDFRGAIERSFRDDGAGGVLAMLQDRIKRSQRKYPG